MSAVQLVDDRPNIELRRDRDGQRTVVLSFPYDRTLVEMARSIPHRRFEWDTREWLAPASDWAALKVEEMLERYPELDANDEVITWLEGVRRRWIGNVSTVRFDGRGWWRLDTLAGPIPEAIAPTVVEDEGRLLAPLTLENGQALRTEPSARLDPGAERCLQALEHGEEPDLSRWRPAAARSRA